MRRILTVGLLAASLVLSLSGAAFALNGGFDGFEEECKFEAKDGGFEVKCEFDGYECKAEFKDGKFEFKEEGTFNGGVEATEYNGGGGNGFFSPCLFFFYD